MDSFTIELVSNASAKLFQDNTLNSFTNLSPEQLNLECKMGGCSFGKISPINVPKHT